jgi:NAD(P)H-dependent FMN reductase
VEAIARERADAEVALLDVKGFDLPFQTSPVLPAMAGRSYDDARVTEWSEAVDACDAFVFVTAEYNHGVPGAFKNAVDLLAPEWAGKTVGFVSYGAVGGVRSVEQWRQIIANFPMTGIRTQVTLSSFTEFDDDGSFAPTERHAEGVRALLDDLIATARRTGAS